MPGQAKPKDRPRKGRVPGRITEYIFPGDGGGEGELRKVGVFGPRISDEDTSYILDFMRPVKPEYLDEKGEPYATAQTVLSKDGKTIITRIELNARTLDALLASIKAKLSEVPR